MFTGLGNLLLELPASLGTFLWCPVLHLQPSHLEIESIFALQHGGLSDGSCHNKYVFKVLYRLQRYEKFCIYVLFARKKCKRRTKVLQMVSLFDIKPSF